MPAACSYRAIQTGDVQEFTLAQVSSAEPLRITLCWADPKASTLSAVALVNDLDLEVEDPLDECFEVMRAFKKRLHGSGRLSRSLTGEIRSRRCISVTRFRRI